MNPLALAPAAVNTLSGLMNIIRSIEDGTSVSLSQLTKRAIINSRVFIQKECADDEILTDVIRVTMNMYVGFVMTALSMNQMVSDSKTVRDIMSTVATEGLRPVDHVDLTPLEDKISNYFNQEMNINDWLKTKRDGINKYSTSANRPKIETKDKDGNVIDSKDRELVGTSVSTTEHATKVDIPSGRIIQVSLGSPQSKSGVINFSMMLQLSPVFIPAKVAEAFVGLNFTPSIKQRYLQMQAGEISFFKDLIFTADLNKKRREALRADKNNILHDMLSQTQKNVTKSWLKYSQINKDRANIANTILIFDKNTFNKACNTYGLKFSEYKQRQKFFDATMSMMVIIIDSNYNKAEFSWHSIENTATYTFNQLKSVSKSDKYDLTDIMKAYGQGMAPRF